MMVGRRRPSYASAAEDEDDVPLLTDVERRKAERQGSEAASRWQSRGRWGQGDPAHSGQESGGKIGVQRKDTKKCQT